MHRHLVAIKVRVERRTDERMQTDGAALDQHRLERLDAQAVQRRRAVEHDRVTLDDTGEHIPNLGLGALDHLLGGFDIGRRSVLHQLFHYKRLEQLKRHLFGQAALVNLQIRTDNDNRTAGVVDALAEQVLAEAALLALEHVGQALERTVVRASDRPAAAAIVDQRIHRLLKHALLIAHDDIGRAQLQQAL